MGNTNVPFKSRKTAHCFIYSGPSNTSFCWITCLLYFSLFPRCCRLRHLVAFARGHPFIRRRCLLGHQFLFFFLRSSILRWAFVRHSPLITRRFPRNSFIAPQRFSRQSLKLLQARQLLQIAQPKPHQKFLRRLVQNRPPDHFFPSRRGNQPLVQQCADHSGSIHSANLGNLRRRHRLLIRNHRQRLQRRHGQPQRWPQALDEPPHHVVLLRLGVHLVPACHRANLDPALLRRIAGHQFIQRSLHHQLLFAQRLRQLLDRRRLVRRKNNRFQRRSSLFVRHSFSLSSADLCALCGISSLHQSQVTSCQPLITWLRSYSGFNS